MLKLEVSIPCKNIILDGRRIHLYKYCKRTQSDLFVLEKHMYTYTLCIRDFLLQTPATKFFSRNMLSFKNLYSDNKEQVLLKLDLFSYKDLYFLTQCVPSSY